MNIYWNACVITMVILEILEDQHHHKITCIHTIEKKSTLGSSPDTLGLASVKTIVLGLTILTRDQIFLGQPHKLISAKTFILGCSIFDTDC